MSEETLTKFINNLKFILKLFFYNVINVMFGTKFTVVGRIYRNRRNPL